MGLSILLNALTNKQHYNTNKLPLFHDLPSSLKYHVFPG